VAVGLEPGIAPFACADGRERSFAYDPQLALLDGCGLAHLRAGVRLWKTKTVQLPKRMQVITHPSMFFYTIEARGVVVCSFRL
jgi:hypothetical protein